MNEAPLGLLFGILAALIVLSGFFSGSETGMMSLNRYRLRHRAKSGHRGAKRASKLLEEPDSLISTILIGNNLVNNLAATIAAEFSQPGTEITAADLMIRANAPPPTPEEITLDDD